jgi:hypothetical protein
VAAGRSGGAIAVRLEVSEKTVDEYARRAKKKFGMEGRREQFTELYPLIQRLAAEDRAAMNPNSGDGGRGSVSGSPAKNSRPR